MNENTILDTPIVDNNNQAPTVKLYSKNQMTLGTFLGGPLGATYFIAENFKNLGDKSKAQKTWLFGIIGTAILFAVLFFVPETGKIPPQIFPIAFIVATMQFVQMFQMPLITAHTAAGGKLHNYWRTAGISLLCLCITLLIIAGIMFSMDE